MAREGSLHDLSLIDLIELFRMGLKTGVLWLIGKDEQGALYLRAGTLIDAVIVRGPDRHVIAAADNAVLGLLEWQDARFTFQPDSNVERHPIRMIHNHEWLLLEDRRRRERLHQALPEQVIALNTWFVLSRPPGGTAGAFKLDHEQWRILSEVAISPSARLICAHTGVEPAQVLSSLIQLLALGLIEITPSPPSAYFLAPVLNRCAEAR